MNMKWYSPKILCLFFLSLIFIFLPSGCSIDSSQPINPQQEQSKIEFEVPSDVKADFYGVTIIVEKNDTIDTVDVYFETAKGGIIAVNVPARDTSTVTVNAYKTDSTKGNILIATTAIVVPSGTSGLMKITFRTIEFPAVPSGVAAALTSDMHVSLNWQAVTDAQVYLVSRATDTLSFPTEAVEVIEASYTDTAIEPGMIYYYQVSASNIAGTSAPSAYVSVTTPIIPDIPQNLRVVATTPSSISLSFSAVDGATGYIIAGGSLVSSLVPFDTLTTTTFTHENLQEATPYFYQVAAFTIAGTSPFSTLLSGLTQTNPPATPIGVTATAVSSSSITVSWDAATGATGYIVYGGRSPSSLSQVGSVITAPFSHTGLTASTAYYYAVTATNAGGTSARSATVTATTWSAPPSTPTGVIATAVSSSSNTVSWTAVTGATGYIVYGGTSSSSLSQLGTAATTTYSHTGLTAGTAYYYTVAATNAGGTSEQSAIVSATVKAAPPVTPTGVTATAASSTSITVTWTAVTGATSYIIYGGTSSSSLSQVGTATMTSFTHIGLTASTTYYYAVAASNASGTSARSTTVNATTQSGGGQPPAAPTGVAATAASATSITVSWSAVTGATGYIIYGGTSSSSLSQIGTTTTATYTQTGLAGGTTYYYAVAASNASGTSARSTTVSATTQAGGPAAPTGVAAAAASATSIIVTWTAVTGATSYTIYGGTSSTTLSQIGTATTATTYTQTGLTAATTYYYAVTVTTSSGTSARSTTISATTQAASDPAAPTGVLAAAASATSITVTWTAVTGATSYTIYGGTSSSLSQIGTATTGTYTQTGLTAATAYYYAVTVTTSSGTSARSTTVSATTQTGGGPAAPTGVKATASSTSITVTWTAVTGATSYIIYRGTSSTSTSQIGTTTTATTYSSTGLTAGTTYYYAVAAVNASGTSAKSTVVSATTTAATVAKAYITISKCDRSSCNRCRPCPHGAISSSYVVDPNLCVGQTACGQCRSKCPHGAISFKTY